MNRNYKNMAFIQSFIHSFIHCSNHCFSLRNKCKAMLFLLLLDYHTVCGWEMIILPCDIIARPDIINIICTQNIIPNTRVSGQYGEIFQEHV